MILQFPNLDTFALCLSSDVLPSEIVRQESHAALDSTGRLWLEFENPVPRSPLKEIKQLGVKAMRSLKGCDAEKRKIHHWWEALPVQKLPSVAVTERGQVIFDIRDQQQLPELVNEMMRQGNDRQSLRVLNNGEQRTLLRVTGPPYFTLLRALDENQSHNRDLRAYVEGPTRIWTEVGYQHPFANQLTPAAGQHLFIDRTSNWNYLKEEPFRDLYSLTEFELPAGPQVAQESKLSDKLTIPLKLIRGSSPNEVPQLWVLRGDAIASLENFVKHSSDQVLQRLAFAVVETDAEQAVLVRIRPSRLAPPVLPFDGVGTPFRNVLKINNLFVPMGSKVHPPLRRDALRNTLAPDDTQLVWLEPLDEEGFQPRSISERSFQPLTDWVDYILDQHRQELTAWISSHQFQFESYVCPDGKPQKQKPDKKKGTKKDREDSKRLKQEKSAQDDVDQLSLEAVEKIQAARKKGRKPAKKKNTTEPDLDRAQLEAQLKTAEKAFLDLEAPLDAEERFESWEDLATLNDSLKRYGEAAICRLHRLWEDHQAETDDYRTWLQTVIRSAGRKHAITDEQNKITDDSIARLLNKKAPMPVEVAQLAAWINWQARVEKPAKTLLTLLSPIQQFIEKHEQYLSVRSCWLTWSSLSQLAGGDSLLLARSRDRILERLFQHGLAPDVELPSFLRTAGSPGADRFRQVKDRFLKLRETVQKWSKENLGLASTTTYAYLDLIYAYGLARLGEATKAQELLDSASKALSGKNKDDIHHWLKEAYKHRIRQALEGASNANPLPDQLLDYLEQMSKLDRYKVDRLRQHSHILEPHEQMDPYHSWRRAAEGDMQTELARLFDITDRNLLLKKIQALFQHAKTEDEQAQVLSRALELSPRLGEKQATQWLATVDQTAEKTNDSVLQATLLERGMAVAAHYGQTLEATRLFQRLRKLVQSQKKADIKTLAALEAMLSQSFRGLRRLGMRDELALLLEDLSVLVHSGPAKEKHAPERLKLLLQLAGGWFYFGNDKGWEDIDAVQKLLHKNAFKKEGHVGNMKQATVAMAYISAIGQAPLKEAIDRLEDLFENLEGIQDSNTVNSHYSLKQVDIIETLINTVVSDDFVTDKKTLRWLDEEEFLIRRRIHQEMQQMMDDS